MNNKLPILLIVLLFAGIGFFVLSKQSPQRSVPVTDSESQPLPSVITDQKPTTDTSSWTVYTNKTYNYNIKFPNTYEVQPGNEEQNACIRLNIDSPCEVLINIYPNKDNLSLEDYLSNKSTAFSIDGPLIPYNFNGYDTLFNKNQPGTNLFIKKGLTVFRFIASKSSSDKEIGDIVATFKFTQ